MAEEKLWGTMLWGDDDLVRDPVGATYPADKQINSTVASQKDDENSLYRYYCKLLTIRHRYPAIARGKYTSVNCGQKNLGGFYIEYENEALILLHNTSPEEISYDLSKCTALDGKTYSKICDSIGQGQASLDGTVLTLGPRTSVIIK